MSRRPFDLSLYLVTDRTLARGRELTEIVSRALAGGASCVQLREKEADSRTFYELALEVRRLTRRAGATFIINDRLDMALASDADGLHVGQEDLPPEVARRLLGPERILGVTTATPDQARRAVAQGADYLGCNAVFATPTKTDTGTPLGVSGLHELVTAAGRVPVVAIGGIKAANAAEVLASGVAGVAVVSAIVSADDPEEAAREFRRIVDFHRPSRGAGHA